MTVLGSVASIRQGDWAAIEIETMTLQKIVDMGFKKFHTKSKSSLVQGSRDEMIPENFLLRKLATSCKQSFLGRM